MSFAKSIFSYLISSLLAIGVAFYFSSAIVGVSKAQDTTKQPLPQESPTAPEQAAPAVAPAPAVPVHDDSAPIQQTAQGPESILLDFSGGRDPFKPYRGFQPVLIDKPGDKKKIREIQDPILSLELRTVEVVAVLWDVKEPRALLRTPSGLTFTIKRNSKIGRNDGVVVGIREGEVIVMENYDDDGRKITQYTSLKMAGLNINRNSLSVSE